MIKRKIIASILTGLILTAVETYSQEGLKPSVKMLQTQLTKNYENIGYGDYELDEMHRKLGLLVPGLKSRMIKDDNGEDCIKLEITSGESVKSDGSHYLISGFAYLYPASENGKLKKIVMEYFRQNASGVTYKVEKRQLANPSPDFRGDNTVDSNDDIMLSYYETTNSSNGFNKIRETKFNDIDRHDRKIKLISAYKNYLRKTVFALERNITDIELSKVTELLYMLEFE